MSSTIQIPASVGLPERLLFAAILFYSGVVFCLPVPFSEEVATSYPWWGKRIVIGNAQLHELLFLGWIVLYGRGFLLRALLNRGVPTRQATVWLITLAVWCGLISMTAAPLPWLDLGRTFRLLLNAALLFAVVRWTRQTGCFPLQMLVLGFFIGTVINLVLSFQHPLIVNGTMRLSGQNTPGVVMGIAIHLSAWLFLRTNNRGLQAFTVLATAVFAFGCAISYSRIGWFSGAFGALAWGYILIAARPKDKTARLFLRKARRIWGPVLVFGLAVFLASPAGERYFQWIQTLVVQKFTSSDSGVDESAAYRMSYAIGVGEILVKHPWGVGYSGFFDAMTATDIYKSGRASEEVDYEANPHSAFLYYASAGGIPASVMVVAVFFMLLISMRWGLVSAFDRAGMIFFTLAVLPYLLIGLTVPYLLNSTILIVPAAVAAGWGWRRRVEQVTSEHLAADH